MVPTFARDVSDKIEVDGKMYPATNSDGQRIHPVDEEYGTSGGGLMVFYKKDWTARVRKAKTDTDISAR
jgi:hypothetical protein